MSLELFNVVVLGDSFPVSSLRIEDFEFRHRKLKESVRLPVALQATAEAVSMMVIPERFEVAVNKVDDASIQAAGLLSMVEVFLEYVGRRTVRAIGHNMVYRLEGTADRKTEIFGCLLRQDRISQLLDSQEPIAADLTLTFKKGAEDKGRLLLKAIEPGDVVLDFNFHYDLTVRGPEEALAQLEASIAISQGLVDGLLGAVAEHGASL